MALTDKLTAIADAVRAKTGGAERLTLDEMAVEISGISGGNVLIIGNENLHDSSKYTADKYLTGSGNEVAYSGWRITDYIPIKANTLYAIISIPDGNLSIAGPYSGLYDSGKTFVSNLGVGGFACTTNGFVAFLASQNGYIRFSSYNDIIAKLKVYECVGSFEYATGIIDTDNTAALSDDIPAEVALDILTGGGPAE